MEIVRPHRRTARELVAEIVRYKASYVLMFPFTLVFACFVVVPVLIAIYYSFSYYNILQPPQFIGLNNYLKLLFDDEIFITSIQNTLLFAAVTGPLSYLLCLMIAWLINELQPKLRAVLTLLFFAPSLVGGVVIWKLILSGDQYGILNSLLLRFNLIQAPIQWFTNSAYMKPSLIVVVLWASLGLSFLGFVAALQGIDRTLYEAGAVDGIRNRYQELWFITLPSMKGQLMFGAIISITSSFGIGDVITTYCGFPSSNYAAHTIMNHLTDYGTIRFEMGYACTIATILFVIMIVSNKLVQRLISNVGS
jgi:multiple sugar transport system permease protein